MYPNHLHNGHTRHKLTDHNADSSHFYVTFYTLRQQNLAKKKIRKNVQFWDFLAPKIETYFVLSFFRSLEKTKSKICRSVQRHDPDGRRW